MQFHYTCFSRITLNAQLQALFQQRRPFSFPELSDFTYLNSFFRQYSQASTVLRIEYVEHMLRSMQVIMELLLVIGLATLASSAAMIDPDDDIVSAIEASELDPEFPRKFQGILQKSINNAVNDIRELRPANYTAHYKQPNGNMPVTVVAAFGAMTVKGMDNLELEGDVNLFRTMKRNLYLDFLLKGQPLKFAAHVTVSSMGMATQFDVFGKIFFQYFSGYLYHKFAPKPSIMIEASGLDEPGMEIDAFVPKWLNRTMFISESVTKILPFTEAYIVKQFSKHVLLNLNLETVEDTLNKYRNSD